MTPPPTYSQRVTALLDLNSHIKPPDEAYFWLICDKLYLHDSRTKSLPEKYTFSGQTIHQRDSSYV